MTAFNGTNPSFAVIKIDQETLLPIDIEVHSFDLAEANKAGS